MNAPIRKLTGISEIDLELSNFYRLRSEVLDCFADIESSLLLYLVNDKSGKICETAPLGHKLEAAKKVGAGPQRSRELKAKADAELDNVADLLKTRADLVHARMEVAITTQSHIIAIFRNAKNAATDQKCAAVFTLEEFRTFVIALKAQQKALEDALTARNPSPPTKAKSTQ